MPERIPQSTTIRVPLQAYLSSDHVSAATGKTLAVTISKNGGAYGNPSGGATNATEIANGSYYVDLSTTDTGTLGPIFVRAAAATVDDVIVVFDVVKATTGGYTALPDTACTTNGSLLTAGTGTSQINPASGKVPATLASTDVTGNVATDLQTIKTQTVTCSGGVTVPAATLASTTNITAGTMTTTTNLTNAPPDSSGVTTLLSRIGGALTISGGAVNASLVAILGTALTETLSGYLAAAFNKFFNVATPTSTMNEITLVDTITTYTGNTVQTGDAYARLGAPAGASHAADVAAVKSDTGSLVTSVGALWTTALTESYATDGSTFTPAQALYMIYSVVAQASASGTTLATKKLDGTTTAMTFTLDSSTPTSRTRTG